MNTANAINDLSEVTQQLADLVDRIAPRRSVLEEKLLRLTKSKGYTWKWHPGSARVTVDLIAGYRVTFTPSEDVTMVTLAKRRPGDSRGLTEAVFPDLYVSLDVWYGAYDQAVRDDGLTLDEVLSGRTLAYVRPQDDKVGPLTQKEVTSLVEAGLVRAVPRGVRADTATTGWVDVTDQTNAAAERKTNSDQTKKNTDAIEELRAILTADKAGDCGDEG